MRFLGFRMALLGTRFVAPAEALKLCTRNGNLLHHLDSFASLFLGTNSCCFGPGKIMASV